MSTSMFPRIWSMDHKYLKLYFGYSTCSLMLKSTPYLCASLKLHHTYYGLSMLMHNPLSSNIYLQNSNLAFNLDLISATYTILSSKNKGTLHESHETSYISLRKIYWLRVEPKCSPTSTNDNCMSQTRS